MIRLGLCLACNCVFTLIGFCQIVDGNAFIKGNFVEVGINQCGGFGSTVNAPVGYHARSGIDPRVISDNQLNLGFVADPARDGWSVGTPNYQGDYFMPFAPLIGWSIVFNGNIFGTERTESSSTFCSPFSVNPSILPFYGSNSSVFTTATDMGAIWQGTINGLHLQKTVIVPLNELYFTVRIDLKNTTSAPMTGVYYGDYVNPDNDAYQNDVRTRDLETANSIVNQNPIDNQALVQSIGFGANTYIGLGSRDCRARVFRGRYFNGPFPISGLFDHPRLGADEWFSDSVNSNVTLIGADPGTGGTPSYVRNGCIGIAFNIGTIAPGDSTNFTYTYILRAEDFAVALTQTEPGFTDNINQYNSGDVITPCANSTLNLKITSGDYNTWTWSPTTGLNTTIGPNVVATVGTAPITYTATSTGSCGNRTVNVVIQPAPTPVLGNDQTITACSGIPTDLTTIFNTAGAVTNWTIGGAPVTNPAGVVPGIYQLIAVNPNGCSDTALVNISQVARPILGPDITTGICAGNTVNLTTQFITAGLTVSWTTGGNPVNNPSSVSTGVYQLVAGNINGCTDTALITINQSTPVNLRIASSPAVPTIIEGEKLDLTAVGNNIANCQWQPALYLSATVGINVTTMPMGTIRYQATAVNINGCRDTAFVNITVLPFTLEVLSAFTPNADGYTDKWVIRNLQVAKQHKVIVFNRWGNKVFESNNYQNNWDGTHNGIPVPDGAYYYMVEAITVNDRLVIKKGSLTILR